MADYQNPYIDQSGFGLSPEAIAARRRYAYGIMQQAGDGSPTKANAIGAVARALQGAMGGYMVGQADKDEMQGINAQGEMLAKLAGGIGGGDPTQASLSPAQAAQPMGNQPAGKIYNANEPSPLDPPSGQARDLAIRTIYGEDPGKSALGVANVIRNRAVSGQFGGDNVPGVVMAKNQFEPWNNTQAKARMLALNPNSPDYSRLGGVVDQAYAGNDPTNGATSFYSPTAQAALGRSTPQWAQGPSQDIGEHRFYGGATGQPTQLAGPPPSPDSASAQSMSPQGVAQALSPQPPQMPQPQPPPGGPPQGTQPPMQGGQQASQQLVNIIRDPNASVYQKRAASTMLQGVLTKQMGAELKPIPQPDGSVLLVNPITGQSSRITDPGMIQRLGSLKQAEGFGTTSGTNQANLAQGPALAAQAGTLKRSEGYGTTSGTNQANIEQGPALAAVKGAEAQATASGTSRGQQEAAAGAPANNEITSDISDKIQSLKSTIDNEGWIPVTGMKGGAMAMKSDTQAANFREQTNQLKSAFTSEYINGLRAKFPNRLISAEQVKQKYDSIDLNPGDPVAMRKYLVKMEKLYPSGAQGSLGGAASAGPLKSGTYNWTPQGLVPQ